MRTTPKIVKPPFDSDVQSVPRFKDRFGQLENTAITIDNFDKMIFTNQGFRYPNNSDKQKVLASNEIGDVSWKYSPVPIIHSSNNRHAVVRVFEHFNSAALENESGGSAGYLHIHTGLFTNIDSKMFHFHVKGYAYGAAEIIDLIFVGYCYKAGDALYHQKVSQRADTALITDVGVYRNVTTKEIILRFASPTSTYYMTFVIDSQVVGNGSIYQSEDFSMEFNSNIELS